MTDIAKQVRSEAEVAILVGRISEKQVVNLKTYPFACFDNVLSARVEYSLGGANSVDSESDLANHLATLRFDRKPDSSVVQYYLNLSCEETSIDHLKRRCEFLEICVHNLLWNGIRVEVYLNEKMVHPRKEN